MNLQFTNVCTSLLYSFNIICFQELVKIKMLSNVNNQLEVFGRGWNIRYDHCKLRTCLKFWWIQKYSRKKYNLEMGSSLIILQKIFKKCSLVHFRCRNPLELGSLKHLTERKIINKYCFDLLWKRLWRRILEKYKEFNMGRWFDF